MALVVYAPTGDAQQAASTWEEKEGAHFNEEEVVCIYNSNR